MLCPVPKRSRASRVVGGKSLASDAARGVCLTLWTIPLQDVRHAVRGYGKAPLFTVTILLIFALGIGANSAIFAIVDDVLLRPLDYPQADSLVSVSQVPPDGGRSAAVSPPNFFDLRDEARSRWRDWRRTGARS